MEDIDAAWESSVNDWILFLQNITEEDLFREIRLIDKNGTLWSILLKDIVIQLNYHSIHHIAQIQMIIRHEGIKPDFIDYIGTKFKKVE